MSWLRSANESISKLRVVVPQLIQAAQKIYDEWDQSDAENGDPELGLGGICQDIADAIATVLLNRGFDAGIVSATTGEQHVWTIVKMPDGVYEVDIPYYIYETGGGYNWKKIEGVIFDESCVHIDRIDKDPRIFEKMLEYG